jgi:hypothetical protein
LGEDNLAPVASVIPNAENVHGQETLPLQQGGPPVEAKQDRR